MKTIYHLLIFAVLPFCAGAKSLFDPSILAQSICENTERYDYAARFRRIHSLDQTISLNDAEYYLNFLERPFEKGSLTKGQLAALKNDLADKLLAQRTLPRGFTERFLRMMDQEALGVVWRDYVVQKLPDLYERTVEKEGALVLSKLWETTDSQMHTFSGTALLGLNRVRYVHPESIDSAVFAEKARAIVTGSAFPEPNKATALQLLAEESQQEALRLAREILCSEASVMLHISAMGILGISGEPADKNVLSHYAKSSEFRLRRAAQSALKRFD